MARASSKPVEWQMLLKLSMEEFDHQNREELSEELKGLGKMFYNQKKKKNRSRYKPVPVVAFNLQGEEMWFENTVKCAEYFGVSRGLISAMANGYSRKATGELENWEIIYEDELEETK